MDNESSFLVRRARREDAAVIAWHRARMFQEMGDMPAELFDAFREAAEHWTAKALETGEYVGWLGSPAAAPEAIVGGAGVQQRRVAPHPRRNQAGEVELGRGRHALVINVFTEPEWRRRGLGELVMRHLLEWARAEQLDRVVLHASEFGRGVYEKLGFVPTNEMRYSGDLQARITQ
jgi:GNAT superfamily N-acetyltransferase